MLFFLHVAHRLEVVKDGTVDKLTPSPSPSLAPPPPPPVRPTTLWHLLNTASAWSRVKQSHAGTWTVCPCDCEVYHCENVPLCMVLPTFVRIATNVVGRIVKLQRNLYELVVNP